MARVLIEDLGDEQVFKFLMHSPNQKFKYLSHDDKNQRVNFVPLDLHGNVQPNFPSYAYYGAEVEVL